MCLYRAGPLLCWIAREWWLWWPGGGAANPCPRTISESGLRRIFDWTRLKYDVVNNPKHHFYFKYQQHAAAEKMRTLLVIVVGTTATATNHTPALTTLNCGHHLRCWSSLLLLLPLSSCQQFYDLFNLKYSPDDRYNRDNWRLLLILVTWHPRKVVITFSWDLQ